KTHLTRSAALTADHRTPLNFLYCLNLDSCDLCDRIRGLTGVGAWLELRGLARQLFAPVSLIVMYIAESHAVLNRVFASTDVMAAVVISMSDAHEINTTASVPRSWVCCVLVPANRFKSSSAF